jgi:hypothetical protein
VYRRVFVHAPFGNRTRDRPLLSKRPPPDDRRARPSVSRRPPRPAPPLAARGSRAQVDRIAKLEVPRFCEGDGRPMSLIDLMCRMTRKSDVRAADVRDHEKLQQMLKDKNIELTYARKGGTVLTTPRQREKVFGASPFDQRFTGKFTGNGVEYFLNKYNIKLKYPHAPTVRSLASPSAWHHHLTSPSIVCHGHAYRCPSRVSPPA